MLLGCIGDDFTGSSDLANTLAKQGMRTVQYAGVPSGPASSDVEAGVVALKSRSNPVEQAVRQSLDALQWLQSQGCSQYLFKYCSTFDSTPEGNIGPVADALANALSATAVIVCPVFPGTGRTIYQGHLFVNDTLLSESGMENHPITPMTDPDIRRWLRPQTQYPVAHVPITDVKAGAAAISAKLEALGRDGIRHVVVDAISDDDLFAIGAAAAGMPLVTGGSGVALGLPENFRAAGLLGGGDATWRGESGPCVALSGSCSIATRAQVEAHGERNPVVEINADDVLQRRVTPNDVASWLLAQSGVPLAYSSADPAVVSAVQAQYGRDESAAALEVFFSDIAKALVAGGITKLLVAGGETSGAVIEGLGIDAMEIGPEIDPGVPAMRAGDSLVVAMKSGNFGAPDFFEKGARVLAGDLAVS